MHWSNEKIDIFQSAAVALLTASDRDKNGDVTKFIMGFIFLFSASDTVVELAKITGRHDGTFNRWDHDDAGVGKEF